MYTENYRQELTQVASPTIACSTVKEQVEKEIANLQEQLNRKLELLELVKNHPEIERFITLMKY